MLHPPGALPYHPLLADPSACLALRLVSTLSFTPADEQDSLEALKALMPRDDWDDLQAVTSAASYFA